MLSEACLNDECMRKIACDLKHDRPLIAVGKDDFFDVDTGSSFLFVKDDGKSVRARHCPSSFVVAWNLRGVADRGQLD